ncbi:hypothetical protein YC2023_103221 [Brassica napus]
MVEQLEGLMLLCGDITAHVEDTRLDSTARAPPPLASPSDYTTGESATGSSQQLHHLRLVCTHCQRHLSFQPQLIDRRPRFIVDLIQGKTQSIEERFFVGPLLQAKSSSQKPTNPIKTQSSFNQEALP